MASDPYFEIIKKQQKIFLRPNNLWPRLFTLMYGIFLFPRTRLENIEWKNLKNRIFVINECHSTIIDNAGIMWYYLCENTGYLVAFDG